MLSPGTGVRVIEVEARVCFIGAECVDWLVEQNLSRVEALAVADKLMSLGFFKQLHLAHHPSPVPPPDSRFAFLDDATAYYVPCSPSENHS